MNIITSHIIVPSLQCKMLLPKGDVLGFFVSNNSKNPLLNASILHSQSAPLVEYNFYIITEPQPMNSLDSLGKYYGSFDVSPEGQSRTIHVFEQLYKDK